jgi:hypothetical protein
MKNHVIRSLAFLGTISIGVSVCALSAQVTFSTPSAGTVILKEGTQVKLRFAEDLTSKTAVTDDPVNFNLGRGSAGR